MNNYLDLLNDNFFEIEEVLNKSSKEINKKHFEFIILLVKLFDNLINFEEFEKFYDKLFEGLNENDVNLLNEIFKLEIKDILEFRDNNLCIKQILKKERK